MIWRKMGNAWRNLEEEAKLELDMEMEVEMFTSLLDELLSL